MSPTLERLKKQATPILKRYGVKKAAVFGSYARGEAKKSSDIDILVEFKGQKSLLDLVGLQYELEAKFDNKFDVITYKGIHPRLKDRIIKEQVRLV